MLLELYGPNISSARRTKMESRHKGAEPTELKMSLVDVVGDPEIVDHIVSSVFTSSISVFSERNTTQGIGSHLYQNICNFRLSGQLNFSFKYDNEHFKDPITDYSVGTNSLNYRSPEFVDTPEIIFSGCSVSYGVGIPFSATWINRVQEHLNPESYVSLTKPGISTQTIVINILNYIFKHGKPKKIIVLFPDPYRMATFVDASNTKDRQEGTGIASPGSIELHMARFKSDELLKYSKRPHPLKNILTPEVGFKSTLESIYSLEVFCKAADIELIWSSWDITTAAFATILNSTADLKPFPSFSMDIYKSVYYSTVRDHAEDVSCKPEVFADYPLHYAYGTDAARYYGAHVHSHIAEAFIEQLDRKNK